MYLFRLKSRDTLTMVTIINISINKFINKFIPYVDQSVIIEIVSYVRLKILYNLNLTEKFVKQFSRENIENTLYYLPAK